ncbi:hypothetical protein [Desulfosporosinus sp. SB140]|uniref:hypothetical protein n=1 Tax=Desulfosporosinus paludis TaxID=3115649 RepID=UPI00388CF374
MEKNFKEIFGDSQNAINAMQKVFDDHKHIETVIVNPESWVGKELLLQTKMLIDLQRDVRCLTASINRMEKKLDYLLMPRSETTGS